MQTEINPGGATATANNPPQQPTNASGAIAATAPGQLRVIKRNGTVVPFEASKIAVAITKAFLAVEGGTAAASTRIHETVAKLTAMVAVLWFVAAGIYYGVVLISTELLNSSRNVCPVIGVTVRGQLDAAVEEEQCSIHTCRYPPHVKPHNSCFQRVLANAH